MRRGTLLLLLSAFLWGTTFPATRYGLEVGLKPYTFLLLRFAIATASLLAFALATRRVEWALFRDWRLVGLGVLNALGYVLQYVAQDRTTASRTALLVNVNVLITALLAWLILKERVAKTTGLGAVLGLVGVVLLSSGGDLSTLRFSNTQFVGDTLAFGTGMCWTVYILVMKRYFTRRPDADAIPITLVLFVVTTILLVPATFLTDGLGLDVTARGWGAILYLSVFPTVVALWAYQEGLKVTSAAVSSVLLLFEPVVAVAISFVFLQEGWTLWTGVGAILILVGMYLASRSPGTDPSLPAGDANVTAHALHGE